MPDLDQLLRSDIAHTAAQAVEPFDFTAIERRAASRRRNTRTALAVSAAAAAGVAALVGSQLLPGSRAPHSLQPVEQPSVQQMPSGDAPLLPGTYLADVDESTAVRYTISFPAGWDVEGGNEYAKLGDSARELSVLPFQVDEIYTDACLGDRGTVTPVGPRPYDLVTALLAQPGPLKSTPVATTLGGFPATRVDLQVPASLREQDCFLGPGTGVQIWLSKPDDYLVLGNYGVVSVYVVDVNGRRQVFTTQYLDYRLDQDRDELQQVLDSIRIQP